MKRVLASLLLAVSVAAHAANAPFLWRVEGPTATHYLLGSMHLLPAVDDALPAGLETAYQNTDGVVFETDIGALASRDVQLQFLAAAHRDTSLRHRVSIEIYHRLEARAHAVHLPLTLCDRYAAWFCAINLEVYAYRAAGMSDEYGIDQHFYGEAVNDGKTVQWLESPRRHLAVFTGLDAAGGRALLASALDSDTAGSPQALYEAWHDDDVGALTQLDARLKRHYPQLYARFLSDRNRRWLPQLKDLFDNDSPQLVVVGAAHLVGPDGLVTALRAMGYRVEAGLPRDVPGERSVAWRAHRVAGDRRPHR